MKNYNPVQVPVETVDRNLKDCEETERECKISGSFKIICLRACDEKSFICYADRMSVM